jgi:hypothetical protein
MNKPLHKVQVTSFGGNGTTALSTHLEALGCDLPQLEDWGPYKHQRVPPSAQEVPEGFRAIYLFGDPRDGLISVFRRGYQIYHYQRMHLNPAEPTNQTLEELSSLEAFVAHGTDIYRTQEHVSNWLGATGFPVLFVRYGYLPGAWHYIRDFVGLPVSAPEFQWNERSSDWRDQPPEIANGLTKIFSGTLGIVEQLPSVFRGPQHALAASSTATIAL